KSVCHNSIKNDLKKLKGKDIVDNAAQMSNAATIAPGMYKIDPVILTPKVKNNKEAHEYYLKHTMEQANIDEAFGRNTRDLGSFGEETDKTTELHQHCSRISPQKLETASQITCDAVTMISKTVSQDLKTASDCMTHPII
ncbi:hypothetical protein Tco_1243195, partial [Tanacetum coccineum]